MVGAKSCRDQIRSIRNLFGYSHFEKPCARNINLFVWEPFFGNGNTVWEYPTRSFSAAPAAASDSDSAASRKRLGGTFDEKVVGRFAEHSAKKTVFISECSDRAKTASESAYQTFPHTYFIINGQFIRHASNQKLVLPSRFLFVFRFLWLTLRYDHLG